MKQCAKAGTCMFIWHDGKERYDEVEWDPRTSSESDAIQLAALRLNQDIHATRVQVEYTENRFAEVVRDTTLVA